MNEMGLKANVSGAGFRSLKINATYFSDFVPVHVLCRLTEHKMERKKIL